jgi:amidase
MTVQKGASSHSPERAGGWRLEAGDDPQCHHEPAEAASADRGLQPDNPGSLEPRARSLMTMHTVNRRTFLKTGALGSAGACVPGDLNAAGVAEERARSAAPVAPFELEEVPIATLQDRMASGAETSRSITEKYLARIAAVDREGPALRQVLETNPDALAIAAERDAERKAGRVRGPLHGVPILLKDNIGTADRMTTTAGSLALEGSIPAKDSCVARKLREAGAVLLGKTNMSEWANFRSTHSTSGWSGRGGLGRNPYALDRNTSGSSSGSAAAVAASYAAAAIGTETDGSIVSPANNNCLVGIKPTLGLVSRAGIIPVAHTQDTAGPMARTVADAAAVLTAIAGFDPADGATKPVATRKIRDYTEALVAGGLAGVRLGVPRHGLFGGSTHADRLVDAALAVLTSLGAEIIDPVDFTMPGDVGDNELEVLLYEFRTDLNAYLAGLGPAAPVKSLKDIIEFNDANKDREMPYFGQELFVQAEGKGPLTSAAYIKALGRNRQATRDQGIDAVMAKHRLDALVAPTSGPPELTDLVNGDYGTAGASAIPAIAGYPHITVPAGFVFGLPVGVSFFGRAWAEMALIRIAYAYEQATRHRRVPEFAATVVV